MAFCILIYGLTTRLEQAQIESKADQSGSPKFIEDRVRERLGRFFVRPVLPLVFGVIARPNLFFGATLSLG